MEGVDHDKATLVREGAGKLQRLLKIEAVFHQLDALGHHGAVFLLAVAVGNDDDSFQAEQARGHANALAMISAGCRDDTGQVGMVLLEPVPVDQRAAQLECADGTVVFMLDPSLNAGLLAGGKTLVDERPRILRRGRHVAIDHGLRFLNLCERWELHEPSIRSRGPQRKTGAAFVWFLQQRSP